MKLPDPPSDEPPITELITTIIEDGKAPALRKAAPVPDMPERLDQYTIEGVIGRGAMGVVFQARQDGLDRTVALKLLAEGVHASESVRQRFIREARAIARFRHPNIVSVYEVGEYNGQPYFTMDFINGLPLHEFVRRFQFNSPVVIADLCARIADAVHYAHRQGIIHRDLKPSNILLDGRGEPVITDFGLSKEMDNVSALSLGGQIMGTPAFMSPEQAEGKNELTDERSDVYSLGALLYYLLTGKEPFKGKNLVEILNKVIHDEPEDAASIRPDVDGDLEAICHKAMEKDRDARYPSAQALAKDLRAFIDGHPIQAVPWNWRRKCSRSLRRNRGRWSAAAVTAVLVIAAGALTPQFFSKGYLDLVQSQLQSKSGQARAEAYAGLGREINSPDLMKPEERTGALKLLVAGMDDGAPAVHEAVLAFLARYGNGPDVKSHMEASHYEWIIQKAGQDEAPRQRNLAIAAIGKIRRPEFAKYLIGRLKEPRPALRLQIIRALGNQRSRRALYPLMHVVVNDPVGRAEAEQALDKFYAEGAITLIPRQNKKVMGALRDLTRSVADYNRRVDDLLSGLGEPGKAAHEPFHALQRAMRSETVDDRLQAVRELGTLGTAETAPFLYRALDDADETVGSMAAYYLAKVQPEGMVERLASLLESGEALTRMNAARALGFTQRRDAVDYLLAALPAERDGGVKKVLIGALGESGRREAVSGIRAAAARDPQLGAEAQQALRRIEGPSAPQR